MKRPILILIIILILIAAGAFFFTKSGYSQKVMGEIKARGLMEYTTGEAIEMTLNKCSQCHSVEQIKKYCDRCGPPFIVVVHNMTKHAIPMWRAKYPKRKISDITDSQAAAIVQVWNGTIGNWEKGWRREDMERMLEGNQALLKLLHTPVEQRKIEKAISKEEMSPAEKYQREMLNMK